MSQSGNYDVSTILADIETLIGNIGGKVGPDVFGNLSILGTSPMVVTGTPLSNLLTITVGDATTAAKGVSELAVDAEAIDGTDSTRTIVPTSLKAKLGLQTNHAVIVGAGTTAALTSLGVGLTAQVLKGNTAADPSWGAVDLTTDVSGILPVGSGGTGVGTLLVHGLLVGNTASDVVVLAVGATNEVLLGNTGADPSWGAVGNAALTNSSVTLTNGANITVTGSPLSLGGAATIAVSGTTDHTVQVGNATGSLDSLGVGTDGYVLLGATGANPAFAALTSTGGTIVYTPGANTLNLDSGATVPVSFTTDAGSAIPALGVLSILGGTNLNSAGATSIVTVNLDTSITKMAAVDFANAGRIGTDLTIGDTLLFRAYDVDDTTYRTFATLTANNIPTMDLEDTVTKAGAYIYRGGGTDIPVTDGGTGQSTLTDHGLIYGNGALAVGSLAEASNGQIPIGSTGNAPVLATITAGTGISVTNAAGSVTIAAPSGVTWSIKTADLNPMIPGEGYIANKAGLLAFTLPATAAVGTVLRVTGMNTDLGWTIAQGANQQIHFGDVSTTAGAGGSVSSILKRDSIELVCVVTDLEWNCVSMFGNVTIV